VVQAIAAEGLGAGAQPLSREATMWESLNPLGRVIENNHVPLLPDAPGSP